MEDYSFHLDNADQFDENDVITHFPINPYDENPDNLFGLGNKQKKAERKLAKAEKALAQGKTKKAERKLAKADKKLSTIEKGVIKNQPLVDTLSNRLSDIQNLNPTSTASNESLTTSAGQIGAAANSLSPYANTSGGGGGAGDMGGDTSGGYTNEANPTPENTGDEPTGDLATVKDLPNVTVTGGGKNNTILYIIGAIVLILIVTFFLKKKK